MAPPPPPPLLLLLLCVEGAGVTRRPSCPARAYLLPPALACTQAVCKRYGLEIGAYCSWLVRALMWITAPVSWPLGGCCGGGGGDVPGGCGVTYGRRVSARRGAASWVGLSWGPAPRAVRVAGCAHPAQLDACFLLQASCWICCWERRARCSAGRSSRRWWGCTRSRSRTGQVRRRRAAEGGAPATRGCCAGASQQDGSGAGAAGGGGRGACHAGVVVALRHRSRTGRVRRPATPPRLPQPSSVPPLHPPCQRARRPAMACRRLRQPCLPANPSVTTD